MSMNRPPGLLQILTTSDATTNSSSTNNNSTNSNNNSYLATCRVSRAGPACVVLTDKVQTTNKQTSTKTTSKHNQRCSSTSRFETMPSRRRRKR